MWEKAIIELRNETEKVIHLITERRNKIEIKIIDIYNEYLGNTDTKIEGYKALESRISYL